MRERERERWGTYTEELWSWLLVHRREHIGARTMLEATTEHMTMAAPPIHHGGGCAHSVRSPPAPLSVAAEAVDVASRP